MDQNSATSSPSWTLLFVLPNLALRGPEEGKVPDLTLDLDQLAIVSSDDGRVRALSEQAPAARTLLGAFRDELSNPIRPAVLIGREDWLTTNGGDPEPIIAYRNAVAITNVLLTRARGVRGSHMGSSCADTFDFHPAQLTKGGDQIFVHTLPLTHFGVPPKKFSVSTDAGLSRLPPSPIPDDRLTFMLSRAWRLRYIHKRDIQFTRALFRSLEIAYHAVSLHFKNYGSLHEAGLTAALWVSAIEILAAPHKAKHNVGIADVRSLLARYHWSDQHLANRRYRVVTRREKGKVKQRESVNLVQKCYHYLYEARSKFLHGDRVSARLLLPFGPRPAPPILDLASTVYRTALVAYLDKRWPRDELPLLERVLGGTFTDPWYTRHLLRAVNPDPDDDLD